MTPPTTQTGMEKRFDKQFVTVGHAIQYIEVKNLVVVDALKAFIRSEITKAVEAERMRNKGIVLLCYREEIDREARIFNEALDLVYSRLTTLTKEEK